MATRKPKSPVNTAKRLSIEARRTEVARLLKAAKKQREIAKALGVSLATVNRDVRAVRAEWAEERQDLYANLDLDLQRIDAMLAAIFPAAAKGAIDAIEAVLKLMHQRARYLGLYQSDRLQARVMEDWKVNVVQVIVTNRLTFEEVAEEVGSELAQELFAAAGIPTAIGGAPAPQSPAEE